MLEVRAPGKSACASRGNRVIAVIRTPSQQRLTCQRRNRSNGASPPSYYGTMTRPTSYSPPADVASAWLLYQPHEDMAQYASAKNQASHSICERIRLTWMPKGNFGQPHCNIRRSGSKLGSIPEGRHTPMRLNKILTCAAHY